MFLIWEQLISIVERARASEGAATDDSVGDVRDRCAGCYIRLIQMKLGFCLVLTQTQRAQGFNSFYAEIIQSFARKSVWPAKFYRIFYQCAISIQTDWSSLLFASLKTHYFLRKNVDEDVLLYDLNPLAVELINSA